MEKILVGTSGYSYKDWSGIFYPEKLKANEYLSFYSTQFNFTELNFSYYTQPSAANMESIISKVNADFRFAIKAHQSITHSGDSDPDEAVKTFKEGISPLKETGMLAAVLLQFPYSFHYTKENRRYLADVCSRFEEYPVCIEFRNTDWMQDPVYEELSRRNIPLVLTDMPGLPRLPDYFSLENRPQQSGDFLYIRFHGRNSENWWTGDNASRYDYLYSAEELDPWVEVIKKMINEVKRTLVAFNNHLKGQAVRNGKELIEKIRKLNL